MEGWLYCFIFGISARGAVFSIIGIFLIRTAIQKLPQMRQRDLMERLQKLYISAIRYCVAYYCVRRFNCVLCVYDRRSTIQKTEFVMKKGKANCLTLPFLKLKTSIPIIIILFCLFSCLAMAFLNFSY